MTKTELLHKLREVSGEPLTVCTLWHDRILGIIFNSIPTTDKVPAGDLGYFKVRVTQPRTGRNPATGDPIQIPAKKVVAFKTSARLKEYCK
jgi:nucleoid DNA-binding protein